MLRNFVASDPTNSAVSNGIGVCWMSSSSSSSSSCVRFLRRSCLISYGYTDPGKFGGLGVAMRSRRTCDDDDDDDDIQQTPIPFDTAECHQFVWTGYPSVIIQIFCLRWWYLHFLQRLHTISYAIKWWWINPSHESHFIYCLCTHRRTEDYCCIFKSKLSRWLKRGLWAQTAI